MEYRQNADWREEEHPRDKGGKFAEKAQSRHDEYEAEQDRLRRKYDSEYSGERTKRKQVKLDKREYALVDRARKEKYAEYRRSGVPKLDYVFTDDKFVTFRNTSRDNFVVRNVVEIEDNQDFISYIIKEIENGR